MKKNTAIIVGAIIIIVAALAWAWWRGAGAAAASSTQSGLGIGGNLAVPDLSALLSGFNVRRQFPLFGFVSSPRGHTIYG